MLVVLVVMLVVLLLVVVVVVLHMRVWVMEQRQTRLATWRWMSRR